MNTAAAWY